MTLICVLLWPLPSVKQLLLKAKKAIFHSFRSCPHSNSSELERVVIEGMALSCKGKSTECTITVCLSLFLYA